MKYFVVTFLILALLTVYSAADTVSKNASHPYFPGECNYNGKYYPPGEHHIKGCTRLFCSPKGWASAHNCIESSKKECIRGEQIDVNQTFPKCCQREYTCKHGDGSKYTIIDY